MGTRIEDKKMIRLLFLLCWIVYFVTYIGRLNYSSAMPAMIGEGRLTKTQAGTISMVFFFCYGVGQLLNGFLGDWINPRKMIAVGLSASVVANFLMGAIGRYEAMVVLWGLNGYSQAMIWPPIVRIFSDRLQPDVRRKCCIHISSTMALGTLASYFVSAIMMAAAGWQWVFFAAAGIMGAAAVFFYVMFEKVESFAKIYGREAEEHTGKAFREKDKSSEKISFRKICLCSGVLVLVIPAVIHGVLKDGVTAWVPTYISEIFSVTPIFSILVTMVLPVVNLAGAYAASVMNQKVFRGELKTCAFFFAVSSTALYFLWRAGDLHMAFAVILLAIITSSMMAINTLVVNVIPMYFSEIGRSASVSGFLNAMAYLGSAISTFTIGVAVEKRGWSFTILG